MVAAKGKDRGWATDALKGCLAILAVAAKHTAAAVETVGAGVAAGVSAAMIETHAFLTDEERLANAKKVVLSAKDMASSAAQAACAVARLALNVPSMAPPAAAVCSACEIVTPGNAAPGDAADGQEKKKSKSKKKTKKTKKTKKAKKNGADEL